MSNKTIILYDQEVYPNFYLLCYKTLGDSQIHTATTRKEVVELFKRKDTIFVAHNAIGYDAQIVHFILDSPKVKITGIYQANQELIEEQKTLYKPYDLNKFETLDTSYYYQRAGYGNSTKPQQRPENNKRFFNNFFSLKHIASKLGLPIVEMGNFGKKLDDNEKSKVVEYCKNDVLVLEAAYKNAQVNIEARQALQKLVTNQQIMNVKPATAAEKYVVAQYERETQKKIAPTRYKKDTPFSISTKPIEKLASNKLSDWLLSMKNMLVSQANISNKVSKEIELDGMILKLGAGGLHGAKKGIYKTTEAEKIVDMDFASFYPSIIRDFEIAPDHVDKTKYVAVYQKIIVDRLQAKKDKNKQLAECLKLVINSLFGKGGSEYSKLFCPPAAFSVTLYGQVILFSLADYLVENGAELVLVNTDGLTIRINNENAISQLAVAWVKKHLPNFELELKQVKTAIIKSTNEYYFSYPNSNEVKAKGKDFAPYTDTPTIGTNAKIIPNAVIDAIENNKPIHEAVKSDSLLDYCYTSSNTRIFKWMLGGQAIENKTIRYYASSDGQCITKKVKKKDRKTKELRDSIEQFFSNEKVQLAETIDNQRIKSVNLEFYENEVREFIEDVDGTKDKKLAEIELIKQESKRLKAEEKARKQKRKNQTGDLFENLGENRTNKENEKLVKNNDTESKTVTANNYENVPPTPEQKKKFVEKHAVESETAQSEVFDLLFDKGEHYFFHKGGANTLGKIKNYRVFSAIDAKLAKKCATLSYVCLNPFKRDSKQKSKGNVIHRIATTIEFDKISLTEQYERLKDAPYTALVYSGGKSIHAHIRFTRPLTADESTLTNRYLDTLFADSDHKTWEENQYVRMPLGYNYDHKQVQVVLGVKDRVTPEYFFQWLELERARKNLAMVESKKASNTKPIEENRIAFYFKKYVLDKVLTPKKFRCTSGDYNGEPGLLYVSNCPHSHKHTDQKTHGTEFTVFLRIDGTVKKNCYHSSCSGIWQESFKKLLGIDFESYKDEFKDSPEFKQLEVSKTDFNESFKRVEAEKIVGDILPIVTTPDQISPKLAELEAKIMELVSKQILLFSAETGVGKTVLIAKKAVELAKLGKKITILTNTRATARKIVGLVKGFIADADVTVSLHEGGTDGEDESSNNQELADIAVSTYAYLGRKGHTNELYSIGRSLTQGEKTDGVRSEKRVLFLDEIQALLERCKVNLQLAARYLRGRNTYKIQSKCPAKTHQGSCANCIMAYKREDAHKNYKDQKFYAKFDQTGLAQHVIKYPLPSLPSDVFDISTYENDENVFNRFLDSSVSYELPKEAAHIPEAKTDDENFLEYLASLMTYLEYPQLSMVAPTKGGCAVNPDTITKENKEDVNFPSMACGVPHLKGYDVLPILQILEAESVVMCSATIPEDLTKLMNVAIDKAGWAMEAVKIQEIPVTYNATFLTTSTSFGTHIQKQIVKGLKHPSIVVTGRKSEASDVYQSASFMCAEGDVEIYSNDGFEDNDYHRKNRGRKIMLTLFHLRSAMASGLDFPDKNVMMVDCNSYHPQIVCTERDRAKRLKEIEAKLVGLVVQVVGRLLRTTNEHRAKGQDDRQLVFLLHGLKYDLPINANLFHRMTVVKDRFVTEKGTAKNVLDAIQLSTEGKEVPDYKEAEKHATLSKTKDKSTLSKKQREILAPELEQKKEEKKLARQKKNTQKRQATVENKILEAKVMKDQGKSYREIEKKLNLSKYPEAKQKVKEMA